MKILIAHDHAAYDCKKILVDHLEIHHEVEDMGTDSQKSCHYPDFAIRLSKRVFLEKCRGILLCGSGQGMSMVANRFKGIRAALCRTCEDARLAREHNDANILCMGSRITSSSEIIKIVDIWLSSNFIGGRHSERLAIFEGLGQEIQKGH